MKKFILILAAILLTSAGLIAVKPTGFTSLITLNDSTDVLAPTQEHVDQAQIVAQILEKWHYKKAELNDSLSSVIFDKYFEVLDGNKVYFLASEVKEFETHRYLLDDYLKRGMLDFAYVIFDMYKKKSLDRIEKNMLLVEKGFDFSKDEYLETERENMPWSNTQAELDEAWRKIVKSQYLNLKLNNKEDKDIVEVLQKRYKRYKKGLLQYTSEEVFQTYLNVFTESFDPHTSYFSPVSSENFKIDMSRSLEGIGARLSNENDYVTIASIIAGGPAYKSKKIHEKDKIVGVAQEKDTSFVDIVGWRTIDAVQLIRGEKGSIVRLQIIPAEADVHSAPIVVELVRDKIKLEDQSAKKEILSYNHDGKDLKIGVISIPAFYADFEAAQKGDPNYKSTSRDVKKLINELKEENIDGLLIDLRFNGGGSLQEAVELTGLFIEEGPVVQVKDSDGELDIIKDQTKKSIYDGPLGVVVNRFSASASEIFSGAIQDYKRGIVVGENTYGKGTVQRIVPLDRFLESGNKVGQLKITLAKYYRITGNSTQHIGITPDVNFPSAFDAKEYGESSEPAALPWDQINTTDYTVKNNISQNLIASLNTKYNRDLSNDTDLKDLVSSIKEFKEAKKDTKVSLNEAKRRKEKEEAQRKKAANEKMDTDINKEIKEDKEKNKIDDPYLKEGVSLLSEMIMKKN